MNKFLRQLVVAIAICWMAGSTPASVLFLNHFDKSLDADHSQYGEPTATPTGLSLSKDGEGYPFDGASPRKALDARNGGTEKKDSAVRYSAVNLDSRRGTIEMWVKPNYTAEADGAVKTGIFRTLLSAPLGDKGGSMSLYYANYHGVSFTPFLFFHLTYDGHDYIVNTRLSMDKNGWGVPWEKDQWYYIVVTWTPARMKMFINGKCRPVVGGNGNGENIIEKPMDAPPVSGPIAIGNDIAGNRPANALIDEVRISDVPLYQDKNDIPIPTAPVSAVEDAKIVGAGGAAVTYQPDARQYDCYLTDTAPVIDGKLDDPIWQKLPAMSGFLMLAKTDDYAAAQTEARFCRDDKNIYVALLLHEPDLSKLKSTAKTDAEGNENPTVFGDDSAEIYFGSKLGKLPNVQIAVNSLNTRCDILHSDGKSDIKWNGKYVTATGKTDKGWTIEMAFPYSNLGPAPKIGDIWGMRIGRNRNVDGLFLSAINYCNVGYQYPDQFARFIMAGELPKLDVAKQESLLNQYYIQNTKKQVQKFVREASPQLAYSAEVPKEIKDKIGASDVEQALRESLEKYKALDTAKNPPPVRDWNEVRLRMDSDAAMLQKLGYLLANAGGARATMPAASLHGIQKKNNLWNLTSDQLAAVVDPKHGMIVGIWDRTTGQQMVINGYFLYLLQTKKNDINADERFDKVERAKVDGNRLVMECTNPALPGIKLKKFYYLENLPADANPKGGDPRLLCRRLEITGAPRETTLLQVSSRTLFDEAFRKASYYDRIYVIGTLGNCRSQMPATEITSPILQRAWYASEEGRAQFALVNLTTGTGIGEYLYKENDAWILPQAMPSSFWTPFGWDMGFCQTFVNDPTYTKKPYSAELRYHLFRGDHFAFHREYLSLPEYAALRNSIPIGRKALHLAGSSASGVQLQQLVNDSPAVQKSLENNTSKALQELFRPDELAYQAYVMTDRRWPDYPVGDDQKIVVPHSNSPGVSTEYGTCLPMKKILQKVTSLFPHLLSQTYDFVIDIYAGGETYKQHPDWVRVGRDGKQVTGFYGTAYVAANWCPKFVEHLRTGLLRSMDYYGMDICYLDNVGIISADWGRGHVETLGEQTEFLRSLTEELHKRDKVLWINLFQGHPYYDIGYFEGLGTAKWGSTWRDHAAACASTKLYQKPGAPIMPLYWHCAGFQDNHDNDAEETIYLDKTVGSGLSPYACYLDPYDKHFPLADGSGPDWLAVSKYQIAVHHAGFELRFGVWADLGLKNPWWTDPKTDLEAYTLRMPDGTAIVNVIGHSPQPADKTISVDLGKMGFDPSKRTFVWQLLRRDYDKYPKKNPVSDNWNELFSSRACTSLVPGKSELSYVIPQLPPDRLCVTEVTQTPAAIISAAGIPTQTLLPAVLNCRVTGSTDENRKRVTLRVTCDKPVEVIAWWPKTWGAGKVMANGRELAGQPVSYGAENFQRFGLEKGDWEVTVAR